MYPGMGPAIGPAQTMPQSGPPQGAPMMPQGGPPMPPQGAGMAPPGPQMGMQPSPQMAMQQPPMGAQQPMGMQQPPMPGHAPGSVPGFAEGGMTMPPHLPGYNRTNTEDIASPTAGGVIASEVPGRTDKIPMSPAAGAYVIPADVVSGLGEGNTLAGARLLDEMLSSGPYGTKVPSGRGGGELPRPPAAPPEGGTATTTQTGSFALARGGAARKPLQRAPVGDRKGGVPIITAGGEYIVPAHSVEHHPMLGNGDMKRGHGILDAFVKHARAKHIKTLKSLPGPKK